MRRHQEALTINPRQLLISSLLDSNRILARPDAKPDLKQMALEIKHKSMVHGIRLKQDGDTNIELLVYGSENDIKHRCRSNMVELQLYFSNWDLACKSQSPLSALRPHFSGDINELIHNPVYIPESQEVHLARLLREGKALSRELYDMRKAGQVQEAQETDEIITQLVTRVFEARADRNTGLGKLSVGVPESDNLPKIPLVKVAYEYGDQWGQCSILVPEKNSELHNLIQQSGGYTYTY
jgi:hypothetical protein